MFWDISFPWPVWLSGSFSELKITANSTYWKAKLMQDRPLLLIKEQNTAIWESKILSTIEWKNNVPGFFHRLSKHFLQILVLFTNPTIPFVAFF
jgi:hypothetical protein